MKNKQRIKEIERKFIKLSLIDALPIIMIGLGLHAKFGKDSEPIFEFLKNEAIVNGMFIVSIPVVLWCMIRALMLASERKRIENNRNT